MRSGFDYLTFWYFQIFRPLMLTRYIPMPLIQRHTLSGKMNLLQSYFGAGSFMFGGLSVTFKRLSPQALLSLPLSRSAICVSFCSDDNFDGNGL